MFPKRKKGICMQAHAFPSCANLKECFNFPEHLINITHSCKGIIHNHLYVKTKAPVKQYRFMPNQEV